MNLNADTLLQASRSGNDAIRTLILGPTQQPLSREEQLTRLHAAMQLLPTLQLSIEQRRLVSTVTRQILSQLSAQVAPTPSTNAPGTPLETIRSALPQSATPGHLWNWFRSAPTATQAVVVAGGALAIVGMKKLWNKLHWTIKTVAVSLGLYWLWHLLFGRGRGLGLGSGTGFGPGSGVQSGPAGSNSTPSTTPPSAPPPLQQPGGNGSSVENEPNARHAVIQVRVFGGDHIPEDGRLFGVAGVRERMNGTELRHYLRRHIASGSDRTYVVFNQYAGAYAGWERELAGALDPIQDVNGRTTHSYFRLVISRNSEGTIGGDHIGDPTAEVPERDPRFPLPVEVQVIAANGTDRDAQGTVRMFRVNSRVRSRSEVIDLLRRMGGENIQPQPYVMISNGAPPRTHAEVAALEKELRALNMPVTN